MLTEAPPAKGTHRKPPIGRRLVRSVGPRRFRVAAFAMFGLVILGAALLVGLRASRPGVLPNVELAGVQVGGMSEPELRAAVEALDTGVSARTLTVVRPALGSAEEASVSARTADLGYRMDVEGTVRAVLRRGRQGNPILGLVDQLLGSFRTLHMEPVGRLDPATYAAWVEEALPELVVEPREGDLTFSGTTVIAVEPAAGAGSDRGELQRAAADAVLALARGAGNGAVMLTPVRIAPKSTTGDVQALLEDAQQVLAGPVTLTHGDGAIEFTPEELARVLDVRLVEGPSAASLELTARADRVDRVVSKDERAAVEVDPVDATFKLVGGKVKVMKSTRGFRFDAAKVAGQLVAAAAAEGRTARMKGTSVDPELTTADAKALKIDQQVSTFTTYHDCCAPRVTNIHRIADIVRGAIVLPGEVFSINDVVGERTVGKGFVNAPAIADGAFVEQIGGGISQFATTTYNAIFFGGYEIMEHQAHSYWFTRYPMGREATVSWPAPDLSFRNDSKYGIYIQTSYTDGSITVTFYGHQPIDVETSTGPQTNFTDPKTECEEDPTLAQGEVEVVQTGLQGFDVTVTRILHYPDGDSKTEHYFTHYKAEPIIEHRKSCADAPDQG